MNTKAMILALTCLIAGTSPSFSATDGGTDDLVWQHSNGQVHYWPMQGGRRVGGLDIHTPVGDDWRLGGVGDVDGNGTDDVIWHHSDGRVHYWPMRHGSREGGRDVWDGRVDSADWTLSGVGDLDGDGTADLVWRHKNGQTHFWPMKNGRRQSGRDIHIPVGTDWRLAGAGDVDGDGTDDLVWHHRNGKVHFWTMKDGVRQGGKDIWNRRVPRSDWTLADVGDVDGDGTDDIVWRHRNGQTHFWRMVAGERQSGQDIHTPVGSGWMLRAVGDVNGHRLFGADVLRLERNEPVLVILAEFSDAPFRAPLGRDFYDDWFFGRGTAALNESRTFTGYIKENSHGRQGIERAGLVSVRFPSTRACAFGRAPECPASTEDGFTYRARAVQFAATQGGFDFSQYDRNGDRRVTPDELAIVAIAASSEVTRGGQTGPKDPGCVPVGSGTSAVDVCGSLASFNQNATLMTMIHETSHLWGSLDLYGPGAAFNRQMTAMDATVTSLTNDRSVYHFDPWHKMAFGWLQPKFFRLSDAGHCASIRAAQVQSTDESTSPVVLYDPAVGTQEFFMVEFRKRTVPGTRLSADAEMRDATGGVAIWEVKPNAQGSLAGGNDGTRDGITGNFGGANYIGQPGWQVGKGGLWRAEHGDIDLLRSDGSRTGVTLRVGAMSSTASGIQVAWFRGSPPPGPHDTRTAACWRAVNAAHGG